MHELIHSVDALRDIAREYPEPARSWAREVLATWHRELPCGLPGPLTASRALLAANPPGTASALHALLVCDTPPTNAAAIAIRRAPSWGVGPTDPELAVDAARSHLRAAAPSTLELGLFLADHGPLDEHDLRAIGGAPTPTPHDRATATALVVRFACSRGNEATVAACMRSLDDDLALLTLRRLGLGRLHLDAATSVDAAARAGADAAGGTLPPLRCHGSALSRARQIVHALTEGRTDALSTACRATLARSAGDPRIGPALINAIVGSVAFTECRPRAAGLAGALYDRAGRLSPRMAQTRSTATAQDRELARTSYSRGQPGGGAILCDLDPAVVAPLAVERALAHGRPTDHAIAIATLRFAIPVLCEALPDPARRAPALALSRWAPTEAVLEALLTLPVPFDQGERLALTDALCRMGDPAAAARARAILATLTDASPTALDAQHGLLDALHL